MEKIYIRKENITKRINDLVKNETIPSDFVDSIKRMPGVRTIRDNQYLVLEIHAGSGVLAYNVDSSKVPLNIRVSEGEEIDSSFYL